MPAYAQDGTDPADDLRAKLAVASDPGIWKGVLNKLAEMPETERKAAYERVLGPLFDESDPKFAERPKEQRDAMKAFLARGLLEDKQADLSGLETALVDLMANPVIRADVRKKLSVNIDTKRADGWDRMLEIAGRMLPEVKKESECLAVLVAEAGEARAIDVLALLNGFRRGAGKDSDARLERQYLAAYARILGHEFEDLEALDGWLRKSKVEDQLATWSDWHTWDADHQRARIEAEVRRKVKEFHLEQPVIHGDDIKAFTQLIEDAIAKEQQAEALAKYWATDPSTVKPWDVPLQKAAIARAKALGVGPDAKGVAALSGLFLGVVDRDVLVAAMELVNGWGIEEPTEETEKLAREMRLRLTRQAIYRDRMEDQVRLVRFISVLGGVGHLRTALVEARNKANDAHATAPEATDTKEAIAFYIETISAMAQVKGANVNAIKSHYRKNGGLGIESVRVAVVEGLGRKRIRENKDERPKAALFLWALLEGGQDGDVEVQRDPSALVRRAVIQSLRDFGGDEAAKTVAILQPLAREAAAGDEASQEEARTAASALVRLWSVHKSDAAGDAVAKTLEQAAQDGEMLSHVLAAVAGAGDARSVSIAAAVRGVLRSDPAPTAAVRDLAVRCLTALADALSLDAFAATWMAAREQRRALPAASEDKEVQAQIVAADGEIARSHKAVLGLAGAVAKGPAEGHRALLKTLRFLSEKGGDADSVLSLLEGASTKTVPLRLAEAYARSARALYDTRPADSRMADADAALLVFADVIDSKDLDAEERGAANKRRFDLNVLRGTLRTDPAGRADAYLKAWQVAAGANDKELAQAALGAANQVDGLLQLDDVPDDTKGLLQELKGKLEKIAAGE